MFPAIQQAAAALVAVFLIPGVAPVFGYLALSIVNAAIPGPPESDAAKLLDRLAMLCRRGAARRWSLPVFGRSVFEAIRDQAAEEEAPPSEPPSAAGFAALRSLAFASLVFVLVLLGLKLAACRLPEPDGCEPWAQRCARDGVPEVCSASQRWTRARPSSPCPPPSACVVEAPDGGRPFALCAGPVDAGSPE